MSREHFNAHAEKFTIDFLDTKTVVNPKQFSTGSFGWLGWNRIPITLGGITMSAIVELKVIAVGSRLVPMEDGSRWVKVNKGKHWSWENVPGGEECSGQQG